MRRRCRAPARAIWSASASNARIPAVPLSQISWLVTVIACVVAAVLLLLNDYTGYFAVVLAVGAAAAVNLR